MTKKEEDKHFFKVPTLRNIEHTAPYFHDGSQESLAEAVRIMAKIQYGNVLKEHEVKDIVTFLKTLSGTLPATARLPDAHKIPKRK